MILIYALYQLSSIDVFVSGPMSAFKAITTKLRAPLFPMFCI